MTDPTDPHQRPLIVVPARRRRRWVLPVILISVLIVTVLPIALTLVLVMPALSQTGGIAAPLLPGATPGPGGACQHWEKVYPDGSRFDTALNCLPPSFPADIPLIQGAVISGTVSQEYGQESWQAQIEVPDAAAADGAVRTRFAEAGYAGPVDSGSTIERGLTYVGGGYEITATSVHVTYGRLAVAYKIIRMEGGS